MKAESGRGAATRLASWIFGSVLLALLIVIFFAFPEELPAHRFALLRFFTAILAGTFGYFMTGTLTIQIERLKSANKIIVRSSGGIALALLTFAYFGSSVSPVRAASQLRQQVLVIEKSAARIEANVKLLEEALRIEESESLVGRTFADSRYEPSARAKAIADSIPEGTNSYVLGLKRIAEGRYEQARKHLQFAKESKVEELASILAAQGENEYYAGNFEQSLAYYSEAHRLSPGDYRKMSSTGVIALLVGDSSKAQNLIVTAFEQATRSGSLASDDLADITNNVGNLWLTIGKFQEAVDSYEHALTLWEASERTDRGRFIAIAKTNLVVALTSLRRWDEARIVAIQAVSELETFRVPPLELAVAKANLSFCYYGVDDFVQAEREARAGLSVIEALSKERDNYWTAQLCQTLAGPLVRQGKFSEAKSFAARAVKSFSTNLGEKSMITQMARALLGQCKAGLGDKAGIKDVEAYVRFVEGQRKHGFANRRQVATAIMHEGLANQYAKNYARALSLLLEARTIFEAEKSTQDIDSVMRKIHALKSIGD